MGKYNSGFYYNKKGGEQGLIYNYGAVVIYVSISEIVNVTFSDLKTTMAAIVRETAQSNDSATSEGMVNAPDWFSIDDTDGAKAIGVLNILEQFNILESVVNTIVNAAILDNDFRLADEVKALANILENENIDASDGATLEALLKVVENANFSELSKLIASASTHDSNYIVDKEPRTAISDFSIGYDDKYGDGFRWFSPFDIMIQEPETKIQVMPASESTATDLPNVDGTIMSDTIYKNRLFTIVGYTLQGMTETQKDDLQQKICELLDSTKNEYKTLTNQRTETTFDVKYSGEAEFSEAPTWFRATLPFDVKPYGRKLFPIEFEGNGSIVNDGDKEVGVVVTLRSGTINPSFSIGGEVYQWNDTVPANRTLVIDFNDTTCYLMDEFGVKNNAMNKLIKNKWVTVPKKETAEFLCLNQSTRDNCKVSYSPLILWKKL